MNEQRKLISWSPHAAKAGPSSPHANEFLVCSSSLRLFRAYSGSGCTNSDSATAGSNEWRVDLHRAAEEHTQSSYHPHHPRTTFSLLDSISTSGGATYKCVDWSHSTTSPYLIAAGQISGKLVAMNFLPNGSNGSGSMTQSSSPSNSPSDPTDTSRIVKEFHPRYARACHVVCWNPLNTTQVATGLDRVRNGCGTLIWDIEQRGTVGNHTTPAQQQQQSNSQFVTPQQGQHTHATSQHITAASVHSSSSSAASSILNTNPRTPVSTAVETVLEPLGRVSNSEATLALSWLPGDPYSLAVATGFKWLRIYDIRGNTRPSSVVAHAKSVNGVCFDPFNPMRLVTHSEDGPVKIWDMRMLTRREIFAIHSSPLSPNRASKTLLEVSFLPTSANRLVTVHRDEDGFKVWDLSGSLPVITGPLTTSPFGAGDEDESKQNAVAAQTQDVQDSQAAETSSIPSRNVRLASLTNSSSSSSSSSSSLTSQSMVLPGSYASVSSLSWHPVHKQRVLAITSHGLVEDMQLHNSVPIVWGATGPAFAIDEKMFVPKRVTDPPSLTSSFDALSLLTSSSPSSALISFDISLRMKVRAMLGSGMDVFANHKIGAKLLSALKNVCEPILARTTQAEGAIIQQTLEDEATLVRVWEWMIQSERAATVNSSNGVKKQARFMGVLTLLLSNSTLTPASDAVAAPSTISPTAAVSSSSTGTTLLSLLKNDSSSSSSTSIPTLTLPSNSFLCTASSGFLPSGFTVHVSTIRSEAIRMCDGWFDVFEVVAGGSRSMGGSFGDSGQEELMRREDDGYSIYIQSLEEQGRYAQAAKIAVFHLDLERALQSLTLGARQQNHSHTHAAENRDLGLVAMALSGYASAAAVSASTGNNSSMNLWSTWRGALNDGGERMNTDLKAIFAFLSSLHTNTNTTTNNNSITSTSPDFISVMSELSLQDKLGFSLRFLGDRELLSYLSSLAEEAVRKGDLEGIMMLGLMRDGKEGGAIQTVPPQPQQQQLQQMQSPASSQIPTPVSDVNSPPASGPPTTIALLQSYLDRTSDIASVAILACFAGFSLHDDESALVATWLTLYRTLLNQWSLWSERAKFDVARALFEKSGGEEEARLKAGVAVHPASSPQSHSAHGAVGAHPSHAKRAHQVSVRPQISVRCNFCGQSLSLETMAGSGGGGGGGGAGGASGAGPSGPGGRTSMFRPRGRVGVSRGGVPDQNSVRIRGCPHCKKSLPRCSLCLVSFDCDTPHSGPSHTSTLKPRKKHPLSEGQEEDITAGASGLSSHIEDDQRFDTNTMHAFSKWFTWCQACRHGGHADHIADWFTEHQECPVTDCKCRCMSLDLASNAKALHDVNAVAGVSNGGTLTTINESPYTNEIDIAHQRNLALAAHREQYHQTNASAQEKEQVAALQTIQSQYPNGLPLDVLAVAQAIQLLNLQRSTSQQQQQQQLQQPQLQSTNTGTTVPSGANQYSSPDSFILSHHVSPISAPLQPHLSHQQQHSQTAAAMASMHQSHSSPYLHDTESRTSSFSSTSSSVVSPSNLMQQQHDHQHHQAMQRAGSAINLTTRNPPLTQTKATFPLTRW